jgi:hypothetical protein
MEYTLENQQLMTTAQNPVPVLGGSCNGPPVSYGARGGMQIRVGIERGQGDTLRFHLPED